MSKFVTSFLKDESGATAIEYGLIAALIAAVLVTVIGSIGQTLNNRFTFINTEVGRAGAAPAGG